MVAMLDKFYKNYRHSEAYHYISFADKVYLEFQFEILRKSIQLLKKQPGSKRLRFCNRGSLLLAIHYSGNYIACLIEAGFAEQGVSAIATVKPKTFIV
jgi:hypothetical protein